MIIDLCDLIKKKQIKKETHVEFNKKKYFDGREYIDFAKPVSINGIFTRDDNSILFNGKLQTELILICSRCLEKFNYEFECPLDLKFALNGNLNDEFIILQSNTINFDDIIEPYISFQLPIKKLCKEDCKGLCPYCGINLNEFSCNCKKSCNIDLEDNENKHIDPRFAKLKDLFKDN